MRDAVVQHLGETERSADTGASTQEEGRAPAVGAVRSGATDAATERSEGCCHLREHKGQRWLLVLGCWLFRDLCRGGAQRSPAG